MQVTQSFIDSSARISMWLQPLMRLVVPCAPAVRKRSRNAHVAYRSRGLDLTSLNVLFGYRPVVSEMSEFGAALVSSGAQGSVAGTADRVVDKQGRTVDFRLRRDRGIAAAQAFLRKALHTNRGRGPCTITLSAGV
jgi:hypothetical protein